MLFDTFLNRVLVYEEINLSRLDTIFRDWLLRPQELQIIIFQSCPIFDKPFLAGNVRLSNSIKSSVLMLIKKVGKGLCESRAKWPGLRLAKRSGSRLIESELRHLIRNRRKRRAEKYLETVFGTVRDSEQLYFGRGRNSNVESGQKGTSWSNFLNSSSGRLGNFGYQIVKIFLSKRD